MFKLMIQFLLNFLLVTTLMIAGYGFLVLALGGDLLFK